jgi:hypothetical protein
MQSQQLAISSFIKYVREKVGRWSEMRKKGRQESHQTTLFEF